MVYCKQCGEKISEGGKFCKGCGFKVGSVHREKPKPKIVKKQVIVHQQRSSGVGGVIAFIIFLVILAAIGFIVISSGILDDVSRGSGVSYVDPCERQLNQCNHGCGEGTFSGVCKEKCTYDYRKCKS